MLFLTVSSQFLVFSYPTAQVQCGTVLTGVIVAHHGHCCIAKRETAMIAIAPSKLIGRRDISAPISASGIAPSSLTKFRFLYTAELKRAVIFHRSSIYGTLAPLFLGGRRLFAFPPLALSAGARRGSGSRRGRGSRLGSRSRWLRRGGRRYGSRGRPRCVSRSGCPGRSGCRCIGRGTQMGEVVAETAVTLAHSATPRSGLAFGTVFGTWFGRLLSGYHRHDDKKDRKEKRPR